MKKVTLWICLVLLGGRLPLHAQCKVATTGIAPVAGGYTVTLPPSIVSAVPTQSPLRLVIRNASGRVSSVSGPVRLLSTGQLWIQTSEQFAFSPQSCPTEAVLQGTSMSESGCLAPEFGIGCFAKWCGGQAYCLPGSGNEGFDCTCL